MNDCGVRHGIEILNQIGDEILEIVTIYDEMVIGKDGIFIS